MILFMVLYLLCSSLYIFIGLLTLTKDSKNKLNRIFCLICMNLSFWAFMCGLLVSSQDAETATFFRRCAVLSWGFLYCEFLHFIIFLTKRENLLKKPWHYILLYLPAVICIQLYFFQPVTANDIMRLSYGWAYLKPADRGILWHHFFNVYYICYMAAGMFLLWIWIKNSKVKREKKQGKVILSSIIITILAGSITDVLLPELGIPLMPPIGIITIFISIGAIWCSINKYRLMNLSPENVALEVLRMMGEGLIIVDEVGIIQEVNKGALKLLGYAKEELKNQPISNIFLYHTNINTLSNDISYELDLLSKNHSVLPVLFTSSIMTDGWGDKLGAVCIFQDISDIKHIQSRLKKAHDELETKVQMRTIELSQTNIKLQNEIKERVLMEEKITKLAFYDHLTDLPNRRLFNDRLNQAIFHTTNNGKPLAILFLDLDSFKMINDSMGHDQGDELLMKVAERLTQITRKSDTVSRVGGDEFLILMQNLENENQVIKASEEILHVLKQPFIINNHELYITTSIGVAMYPIDGENVETLIKNADLAMYEAKEKGKNKFERCTQFIKNRVVEDMKLTNHLYRAIENNELELYYQPQVNSNTGKIIGFEALIRWHHPELGLVSPNKFIPIAEKTGLIVHIGEWVLRTACTQNKAWQDAGLINVPMAVNLSVNQFSNTKIVENIDKILKETGLNPNDLELEITESIFMKEIQYIISTLQQFKELGLKISIDDFGTGYSSMNYLKMLPVDRLKIPMEFVNGITKREKDEAIITAIIILAKKLQLNIIAEGVEREEQIEFLKQYLCYDIQGYYYYKPMPAQEIEELLKKYMEAPLLSICLDENTV